MDDLIRVLVLGTGQMGAGVARLLLKKQGLRLVGALGRRSEQSGMDLGRVIGLDSELGIRIDTDLEGVIARTRPNVAIHTTCSTMADAKGEILGLARNGVNVISIAEEMAFPTADLMEPASEIDRLAAHHGVAVLGTGINPGFVLDTLVIVLSAVCSNIESIVAERVNDLAPFGPTVLQDQGVGLTPEAFTKCVDAGTVVGHIGFAQSIHMIADSVGWEIDRIDETREPIVSTVARATPFVKVEPGQTAGCLHRAVAYRNGRPVITLNHPQQIHPHAEGIETGDRIEIRGTPAVNLSGSPEIPGGEGTVALAVNMIPRVLNATPGLHNMADLPVPAAVLADVRKFIHRAR